MIVYTSLFSPANSGRWKNTQSSHSTIGKYFKKATFTVIHPTEKRIHNICPQTAK